MSGAVPPVPHVMAGIGTILPLPLLLQQYLVISGDRGGTVVKVPCCKSEGRWFDRRWCHWNFSLT